MHQRKQTGQITDILTQRDQSYIKLINKGFETCELPNIATFQLP